MIEHEPYGHLRLLNDFRNYLAIQRDMSRRELVGRSLSDAGYTGKNVAGRAHVSVKSGATLTNGQMVAMSMPGYLDAKSGPRPAYACFVTNAGPVQALTDMLEIFDDEAKILGIVYARY